MCWVDQKFDLLIYFNGFGWSLYIMLQLSLFVLALVHWILVVLKYFILVDFMVGLIKLKLNTTKQNSVKLVEVMLHLVSLNWIIDLKNAVMGVGLGAKSAAIWQSNCQTVFQNLSFGRKFFKPLIRDLIYSLSSPESTSKTFCHYPSFNFLANSKA